MAKAAEIDVAPEEPYALAGARIVRVRTAELFEHDEGVLDTSDIERVHDMRVATRRLRAVLEIFAPCFPKQPFKAALRDVKALADALGERRDPDVHLEAMRAFGGVEPLVERLRERQAAGNTRSRRRSRTPRHGPARAAARARRGRRGARAGVKARKVKGLDPADALADNAERIVRVRLGELCSFMPRAADPAEVKALHDMRIAAKRLRYILEITRPCFGPYAGAAVKVAKELRTCSARSTTATCSSRRCAPSSTSWSSPTPRRCSTAPPHPPHRDAYAGLVALTAELLARREREFRAFLDAVGGARAQGLPRAPRVRHL